jgi:hypothetical protein
MKQGDTIIGVLDRIAERIETGGSNRVLLPASHAATRIACRESPAPAHPAAILRYVKLPDKLEAGNYDEYGYKVAAGVPASLALYPLPGGPWQCWGVFDKCLEPGQYGYLIFTNVKGYDTASGAFTEWDRSQSEPFFTDKLLTIYSVQRAPGKARIIGRNESGHRVEAAAGLLFVPPPEIAPRPTAAPPGMGQFRRKM